MPDLVVREYGAGADWVVVIHGGPGAPGSAAPLARELGRRWRVLEPLQRGSGGRPLTVARHVEDLDRVIRERCGEARPVLVGHSWGAMLALACAAAHPASAAALALVGCGTFSLEARDEYRARVEARLTPADRAEISRVDRAEADPDRRLAALARVMTRVCGCELDEPVDEEGTVDGRAHRETWDDMIELQRRGTYPAAFAGIRVPILMLHGEEDPHPGRMIFDDLHPRLPQLAYQELARCGHTPWLERRAREPFYQALGAWLAATMSPYDLPGR